MALFAQPLLTDTVSRDADSATPSRISVSGRDPTYRQSWDDAPPDPAILTRRRFRI
jgi:hypothetical protein